MHNGGNLTRLRREVYRRRSPATRDPLPSTVAPTPVHSLDGNPLAPLVREKVAADIQLHAHVSAAWAKQIAALGSDTRRRMAQFVVLMRQVRTEQMAAQLIRVHERKAAKLPAAASRSINRL